MDFAEVTRTRRTVNTYVDRRVDDALVREALALSLWAPNHRLTFPIRYVELGPVTRSGLAELAVELKGKRGPLSDVQRTAIRDSVTKPSHLVALGLKRSADPTVAYEDYATLACGVQIATTFLWARGIASKWSTAGWSTHERTYAILGVDPGSVKLEGCLMLGYPAATPGTPERPALDAVLSATT